MADYDGMILTKTGMQLQAQAQLGGELRITKIAIGDGMLESGDSIEDLTGLKNQVMALSIQDMEVTDDGQSRIRALITNDNLTTGFFVREVGVFAKIGDTGTERLYSYTNAGDKADYMPSQGVNVVEEVLEVYIIVGNAQNVTCIIDDRLTLATKLDIEKHDADQTAHADLLHLWQPNRAYAVGDIAYHPNLPSWAYLECITAGTSGATEPTWPDVGTLVTDGTVIWRVDSALSRTGWIIFPSALTYTGADAPSYTFTIAGDYTDTIPLGARIKLTQTTVKYFIVTAINYSSPNTTITVYGGTDYALSDATISNAYYSIVKAPVGFPLDQNKWTVEVTDTATRSQSSPTINTWYNLGNISIIVPIGLWELEYSATPQTDYSKNPTNSLITLSISSSDASDDDFTATASGYNNPGATCYRHKTLSIGNPTSYYLLVKTSTIGSSIVYVRGSVSKTIIRAKCAYL